MKRSTFLVLVVGAAVAGCGGTRSSPATMAAATLSQLSIWPATAVPGTVDSGPDNPVEVGVKFRSDVAGTVSGIRFYKAAANTGTHVGNLWSSSGTLLATATFSGESASGWQQVNFSTPVAIAANTVYVASYHTSVGHYSDTQNAFASAGVDNPPLHALANGVSGVNGVYAYGTTSSFPSQGWNACNYWVDVAFLPTASASSPAIAISPTSASLAAGGTEQFTATVTGVADTTATWSIQESSGCGSISSAGLYTAPSAAATCHVIAASHASPAVTATATVTVSPPATGGSPPATVAVSVTPATGSVSACQTLALQAAITGTTNTAVTWSVAEGASGGSVSSSGVYTAPSAPGTYHVVATSQADSTKSATATLTVATQILSVALSPQAVSVPGSGTVQFSATVTTTCGQFTATQNVATN